MEYTVIKILDDFYCIEQGFVRCFLALGRHSAILFDTGIGGNLLEVVRTITKQPIKLVTTHADGDHIGCDEDFPEHYMYAGEFALYAKRKPLHAEALYEENHVRAGTFEFEVLHTPGHTPGSICLSDRLHRLIIGGDTLQDGTIFMQGESRNLQAYLASLYRMKKVCQHRQYDKIYASHGSMVVGIDIIDRLIELTEGVLAGGKGCVVEDAPVRMGEGVKIYRKAGVSMYYRP